MSCCKGAKTVYEVGTSSSTRSDIKRTVMERLKQCCAAAEMVKGKRCLDEDSTLEPDENKGNETIATNAKERGAKRNLVNNLEDGHAEKKAKMTVEELVMASKRKRVMYNKSCVRCRKSKIKCVAKPGRPCLRCDRAGLDCYYSARGDPNIYFCATSMHDPKLDMSGAISDNGSTQNITMEQTQSSGYMMDHPSFPPYGMPPFGMYGFPPHYPPSMACSFRRDGGTHPPYLHGNQYQSWGTPPMVYPFHYHEPFCPPHAQPYDSPYANPMSAQPFPYPLNLQHPWNQQNCKTI